jgi:PKD repeat protein
VFFKCGTDPTLTINAPVNVGILSSTGVFSAGIFGLKAGTTYYFQACAMTVSSDLHVTGLFCGGILPLSTSGHPPKPTYPTHPTKPTEPTKPTYSPKPTEPTNPTKPTYSPKPTEPTKPTKPTYSPKPTEPTKPTYPPKPTHPTKPTYPPKPTPTSTLTPTPTPTPGGLLEVDFEATEYVGVAPFTVSFKDTTDPAFEATSWLWNFGDRSSSFKQNPVHTYEKPGMYTVTLEVKNNAGITQKIKVVYVIVTGTAKKTDVNDPSVPIVWKGPVVGIDYKTSSITVELAEISVCGYINQDDLICGFEAVGSDSQQINTKISNPDAFGDIRVGDPVIGMSYGDLESGQWLLALARIIKEGNPISIESLFGSRELLDAVLGQISNT